MALNEVDENTNVCLTINLPLIYVLFKAEILNVLRSFNVCDLSQKIQHCDIRNKL